MEPIPLPSSLEEVVTLIQALYQPNTPETVSRINDVLHRVQRSPQGWQIAQGLISNPNNEVKFFAILTIIVKLNRDSAALTEDDAKELLVKIMAWFLQSLQDGSSAMVPQKLCTALVTYFIHFSQFWPVTVRHFLHCLDTGVSVPPEAVDESLEPALLVTKLGPHKLKAALWFARAFVEDVGKTDMKTTKYMPVHERLIQDTKAVCCILKVCLVPAGNGGGLAFQNEEEVFGCYQAWILYAQRASTGANADFLVNPLRELVTPALNCFANENLFKLTAELFTEVLGNYSFFFTPEQYQAFANLFDSDWARQYYQLTTQSLDDENGFAFGQLLLAYGDARMIQLMEGTDDQSQRCLTSLSGLLAAQGYAVGEDTIFQPALEFWAQFVENMIDSLFSLSEEGQQWRPYADQHVLNVVMNCLRKMQWPPIEEISNWDSEQKANFNDIRQEVLNLIRNLYTLNGVSIVTFFADRVVQDLASRKWPDIEASAFCLGGLSDCVSDEGSEPWDQELSKIFSTPFFELLFLAEQIPLRLRQTCLSLFERYPDYFSRHTQFLPQVLSLLFGAMRDPVLGVSSGRAVSVVCSECRTILITEVAAFLQQYEAFYNGLPIDTLAEEKLAVGVSVVIQAMPDQEQRLAGVQQLFTFMKRDAEQAMMLKAHPESLDLSNPIIARGLESPNSNTATTPGDVALQLALRSLRCLLSMAKGLQAMNDPVDLDEEKELVRSEKLMSIQGEIIKLLDNVRKTFRHSGAVTDAICSILKTGFSETELGPFVFAPEVIIEFFQTYPAENPRIGGLIGTACSFIGSIFRGPKHVLPPCISMLLPWVVQKILALPDPESDVEIAQNGIIFVDRVMTKYPQIVFALQPTSSLEGFFLFALKVLDGNQPLPKGAAAEFWTNFITLKTEDAGLQATIDTAMATLGPLLAQALARNFCGEAARSELDKIIEPLKKLVVSGPRAHTWLQQAFLGACPDAQVSEDDRRVFIKKIVGLRGGRDTGKVAKAFWLAARGSSFEYAS